MILDGLREAASSLLSSKQEWHILQLGLGFGTILGILWQEHRDAALAMLGTVVGLTVSQRMVPWSNEAAAARPLELMPWYFLTPTVALLLVGVLVNRKT